MKKWIVTCDECGKKSSFYDQKDLEYSRWTVIAWKLPSGDPRCVCDQCEYGKSKEKPIQKKKRLKV
ncbi:MAG TPA: hypothetical protein PLC59_06465 [Bacteroidales bacterium]|nr:hypothetical protein [Bacteroidales bacterium]